MRISKAGEGLEKELDLLQNNRMILELLTVASAYTTPRQISENNHINQPDDRIKVWGW